MNAEKIMMIEDLPEEVLNYLWKWEYSRRWADPDLFRDITEELSNFGYEFADEDSKACAGEYGDLRGYLGCNIKKKDE